MVKSKGADLRCTTGSRWLPNRLNIAYMDSSVGVLLAGLEAVGQNVGARGIAESSGGCGIGHWG